MRCTQAAFWLLHYPVDVSEVGLSTVQRAVLPQYKARVPLQVLPCVTAACRSAAVSWAASRPLQGAEVMLSSYARASA